MVLPSQPPRPTPPKRARWVAPVILLVFAGVAAFFVLRAPTDSFAPGLLGTASTSAVDADADAAAVELPPRCRLEAGRGAFRVGEDQGPAPEPSADGAGGGDPGEQPDQRFSPFAVVLGPGIAHGQGFAVGLKRDTADGAAAEVALVDGSTGKGRLVRLGRSRGDVEAPLVVGAGDGLIAAMLEPNASGFSLQLATITGDEAKWRAELPQANDESLAFDVAYGEASVVAAWDAVSRDGERSQIVLVTLDRGGLSVTESDRVVSPEKVDAELPRVVPRAGGFWLAYVARSTMTLPPRPSDEQLDIDPKRERYAAEMIEKSWLEVLPLDPTGTPAGPARAITPRKGHVQAFDVARGTGDGLLVAWRDDDTPSGSQGGQVRLIAVNAGGAEQPVVVADEDVGLGVPSLLPGWVAIASARGESRLAPIDESGRLLGTLRTEKPLGVGQLLAARDQSLLLARPDGTAVELTLVHCSRTD